MRVSDEMAIRSLVTFGARQRIVISWWLMKNRSWVDVTPGFGHAKPDRNALALEVFVQYMAQLESLQMTYFALRDKARNKRRSFLAIYQGIQIRETFKRRTPDAKEYSGRRILRELRRLSVIKFRRHLGLPEFEELRTAACGKSPFPPYLTKSSYTRELGTLMQWIRQAVANKKHRALVKAFMKLKHGHTVLGDPNRDGVFVVCGARQRTATECVADVLPLDNSDEYLRMLETDTVLIGGMVIALLGLYIRRSPWQGCADCSGCAERGALKLASQE